MKKLILPIILISIFSLTLMPSLALAQLDVAIDRLEDVGAEADLSDKRLEETVALIINTVLSLVGIILICLIIYAGFLWMTAGGEKEKVTKATDIMRNAVIGLIIIILAYGIASFVLYALQDATW